MNVKDVSALEYADFQTNNVWSWFENDSDTGLVSPVPAEEQTVDVDYDYFFILCSVIFRDGTSMEGNVSINTSNKSAYSLELFRSQAAFLYTGTLIPYGNDIEKLSLWLNKPIDAISPVYYTTNYYYHDGTPIAGAIDLLSW